MGDFARTQRLGTIEPRYKQSAGVGMGIGILLGGFLAEYISYSAAFWVTAAMQCAGTMMFLLFTSLVTFDMLYSFSLITFC